MLRATRLLHAITILYFTSAAAFAQGSPPAAAPTGDGLQNSLQALAEEVKDLSAAIRDLRAEVSRSHEETSQLRAQLQAVMDKLSPPASTAAVQRQPTVSSVPTPAPPAQAASPTEASTEARLHQLEEDQQLLGAKVDEQHQTKVESESKYRVKLSGIALVNVFGNRGMVDIQDVPNLALTPAPLAGTGSVGATVRQSEIGLQAYGPTVAGAHASAEVNFDFMGGFAAVSNGVTDPLVRLRTATVRLDWARTSLVAGQDAPFFSPLSPTSFASLGYPEFADAGNLWTWTPQVRVEHRMDVSESNHFWLQGGLLDPLTGEAPASEYYRQPTAGEQSRVPAAGSRLAWSRGEGEHALTLGVGGYYSRQRYGAGRTVDAWAGTADWMLPMGKRVELSGEFYRGRALGGLGAAEGRSVLLGGLQSSPLTEIIGLDSIGGWSQLKFKATGTVEFNAAYGEDEPFARDLHYFYAPTSFGYTSIARNQSAMVNAIYRPRTDLLFALEYRFLDTFQTTRAANTAGTVNLSIGVLF